MSAAPADQIGQIMTWLGEPVEVVAYVSHPSYVLRTSTGERVTVRADLVDAATDEDRRKFYCGCFACDDERRRRQYDRTTPGG